MRVEQAIGRQIATLRAQRRLSLADLGEALGGYLGKPWSRQAVHQAERGQRSFTAAELTALALALDTSVQALFRAEDDPIELPGRAISPEEYRGILLNRQQDTPLDGRCCSCPGGRAGALLACSSGAGTAERTEAGAAGPAQQRGGDQVVGAGAVAGDRDVPHHRDPDQGLDI